MGTEFLLLDDAHRTYFECGKYLLPGEARVAKTFDEFLLAANDGDDPPEESDRYNVSAEDARRLWAFCETAGWKVRIVGDCWDGLSPQYFEALQMYESVDTLTRGVNRAACSKCGQVRLLLNDPLCAQCEWEK